MYSSDSKSEYCLNCFKDVEKRQTLFNTLFKQDLLCETCRSLLEKNKNNYFIENHRLQALYIYNDQASQWMMQLKEAHDFTIAPIFIFPYVRRLSRKFAGKSIVMVPSSSDKTKERGYHALKQMFGPLNIELLDIFEKDNYKQSKGGKKQRKQVSKHIRLKDVSLQLGPTLLIDDVCTSGESLKTCLSLLEGHCLSIEVFVLFIHPLYK